MARRLHSPASYTIGWIAALPFERAAAIIMLDECDETPDNFEQHPRDDNSYAWGRMGEHNIVIASLPAGTSGTTCASVTASCLIASLPHIRIGLLVGIAGGVSRPKEGRDIRLGDVVVSFPSGTLGGVVQYDLGSTRPGGVWEQRGVLNMPPMALLGALSALQSEHELSPSIIPGLLSDARARMSSKLTEGDDDDDDDEMPDYFDHPGAEHDRLFRSAYHHVGGDSCDSCDSAQEVERSRRDTTDPQLHYGIVASGNTLIRDACERDRLVQGLKAPVVCLEMEAAGIMNHFPCLVVRGISTYADSHSNNQWDRYAAATAAAFTKELLRYLAKR